MCNKLQKKRKKMIAQKKTAFFFTWAQNKKIAWSFRSHRNLPWKKYKSWKILIKLFRMVKNHRGEGGAKNMNDQLLDWRGEEMGKGKGEKLWELSFVEKFKFSGEEAEISCGIPGSHQKAVKKRVCRVWKFQAIFNTCLERQNHIAFAEIGGRWVG